MTEMKPSEEEAKRKIAAMFGRIAPHYDLLNRVMALGFDQSWRKEAVTHLEAKPGDVILDLGAGTGDLSLEIVRRCPGAKVIACDLTPQMVLAGKRRADGSGIAWVLADGEHLPFADRCANGVISGFLLRNLLNLSQSLQEQWRVMKAGGTFVSMDTTHPTKNVLYPLIWLYMEGFIPLWGRLLARERSAYVYFVHTTQGFLTAEELAGKIEKAGFWRVQFARRMLGLIAIHAAAKPYHPEESE